MKTVIFIFLLILSQLCFSQKNPFFSDGNETGKQNDTIENQVQEKKRSKKRNTIISKLIIKNAKLQYKLKESIAASANNYKSEKKISSIFIIFLFAFLYGIFHSLGPGHGKVLIFSYILTEKPKVIKAISTSYLIAMVHALSGVLVGSLIILSLKTYSASANNIENSSIIISRFSFLLIIVIGTFLLIKEIIKKNEAYCYQGFTKISFILSIGLIPCPGTIILLTFLYAMELTAVGYLSVIFIILGMGLTISLVGLASLFSKKTVSSIVTKDSGKINKIYKLFSVVGAISLILIGFFFFIGTLA